MSDSETTFIDGKHAVIRSTSDRKRYMIVSPDFEWWVSRGGAWSRNPFNVHQYETRDAAADALAKFAKPLFDEQAKVATLEGKA